MNSQVTELMDLYAGRLRGLLGDQLIGVYLTGSAVSGEFVPETSDVDVVVVTNDLVIDRAADLTRLHESLMRDHPWAHKIEADFAAFEQLRPTGIDGESMAWIPEAGLVIGPSHAASDDILGVGAHGHAVLGPAPASVFPEVSLELFLAETKEYLLDLTTRPRTRPNATDTDIADWLANLARCLYRLDTGELGSKRLGLAWWSARDPGVQDLLQVVPLAQRGDPKAGEICRSRFQEAARGAQQILETHS